MSSDRLAPHAHQTLCSDRGVRWPWTTPSSLQPKVTIEFAGFSEETLHGAIQEPLDKILLGQLVPDSVDIRILIPDTGRPWAIPCRAEDLADEPAFRQRAETISRGHTDAITESVTELADLGLVRSLSAQVRVHGSSPMFKLCILNRTEAFFGFYPITEHAVTLGGDTVAMYDLMGKDAPQLEALFTAQREAEWGEFLSDCDKYETELAGEVAKSKFTLAELDEEEQSLDRLRRWYRTIRASDLFGAPSAPAAERRLKECADALEAFADLVYQARERP